MFGMEIWFVLAVVSAVAGGSFIFTTKVAAERDYDVVLLSTVSLFVAGVGFLILTTLFSDFSGMNMYVLTMVAVNAAFYFWVGVLRHNSLRCIDTAIYYPIYKTLTPIIAIGAGIYLFHEQFTSTEWIGLILSLLVPLLLISNAEKTRQKNLYKGLRLLGVAAVFAAISAIAVKEGTNATDNILFYATLNDFGVFFTGVLTLFYANGKKPIRKRLESLKQSDFAWLLFWMSLTQIVSFGALIYAFDNGPLGIVYTIQSLYILIPIILSIIYYNEHWNVRKVIAIILSVAALALLK